MPVIYKCDECGKESTSKKDVQLSGISGTSGGILLPERFSNRMFCNPVCFWVWVEKHKPNEVIE